MKAFFKWLAKAVIALAISFGLLTGFCYFYYNLPSHHNTVKGSTDRVWEANSVSIRANEGFARVDTDENGYVNSYPKHGNNIDILVMGSSHTEGFNVNWDENYTYVLNESLEKAGMDMYAYNIGMSGHALVRCFRNLENAVNEFNPTSYVTIETSNLDFARSELEALYNGEYDILQSYESGIISLLQKNDYLRLMYSQLENALSHSDDIVSEKNSVEDMNIYEKYLDAMLRNAKDVADSAGIELVIIYKPDLILNADGSVDPEEYNEKDRLFAELCSVYGITLLDMYDPFRLHYEETFCLPNGFSNTRVGSGHLNSHGHKVIAAQLFEYITEVK